MKGFDHGPKVFVNARARLAKVDQPDILGRLVETSQLPWEVDRGRGSVVDRKDGTVNTSDSYLPEYNRRLPPRDGGLYVSPSRFKKFNVLSKEDLVL